MKSQSIRKHYAWRILIACILIKLGTAGVSTAIVGNFVAPIVKEFGCEVSQFTTMISINAIAMALLYTTAARVITTKKIGLVMGIASLIEVISVALMYTYKNVYMFYFSGGLLGAAQAFTGFVAIPIVVNMWFKKKTGTVLGIIIAVGSVSTIAYTLLSAELIVRLGWRAAYLTLACIGLIITVPAVFMFIKSPEEAGVQPYGADEFSNNEISGKSISNNETGITKKQAFHMPLFYVAWLACILYSYGSGVAGYIVPFTTLELAQSTSFGAQVGVSLSLGTILCSLILGWINDKFGVKAGMLWGAVMTTCGFLLMFLCYNNPNISFIASFVVGLGASMYTVQCPLLARSIVGSKHYSEIWSIMMVANSLIGGGLYSSIGKFYDNYGTFKGAFIMVIVLFILAFIFGSISINKSKKYTNNSILNKI